MFVLGFSSCKPGCRCFIQLHTWPWVFWLSQARQQSWKTRRWELELSILHRDVSSLGYGWRYACPHVANTFKMVKLFQKPELFNILCEHKSCVDIEASLFSCSDWYVLGWSMGASRINEVVQAIKRSCFKAFLGKPTMGWQEYWNCVQHCLQQRAVWSMVCRRCSWRYQRICCGSHCWRGNYSRQRRAFVSHALNWRKLGVHARKRKV